MSSDKWILRSCKTQCCSSANKNWVKRMRTLPSWRIDFACCGWTFFFFSITVWTELKLTWLFSSGHTVTVTGNWQGSMCSKIKVCFVLTLGDCFHVTLPWLSASQLLLVTVTVGFHYRAVVTPWSSTRDPEIPTSLLWPPFCIDFAWGVTKFQA